MSTGRKTTTWWGEVRMLLGVLLAAGLVLIGCSPAEEPSQAAGETDGAPETEPADGATGERVSLTVGDIAGQPSAFLQFAVDQGFFDEEGLGVTVEVSPGGAANVPGVMSGDLEIAGSNVVSMLLARGEGLPLKMISAGTFAAEDPDDDFSAVLVLPDSDIQGPEDLDGRSVAVNTLANIAELTVRAALENLGAGHENIEFVEVPFPDMLPALEEGRVDAVHVIEPFMSIGLNQDLRSVLVPYNQTRPGMAIGSYFSRDDYIEQNPEVIERFVAGVSAASEHIADNPDELRSALPELAEIDPEVAESVNIPPWGGPVDTDSVELIADFMEQFDIISEAPPTEDVVYVP